MNQTVVVFDIETSLDRQAFARATGIAETEIYKIKEALGDVFPKPMFHQIECIGVLRAQFHQGAWQIDRFGAPHRGDRPEHNLIEGFVRSLEAPLPRLISWNGTSFDLPVMRLRAMLHQVSAPALSARKYFARYLDDSTDLCDLLASFDSRSKISLDQVCRAFGIGGKPDDINGSKVQEFVDARQFELISAYCERDVLLTYLIWLRYELFCGHLSRDGYAASISDVMAHLESYGDRKPLLADLAVSLASAYSSGTHGIEL